MKQHSFGWRQLGAGLLAAVAVLLPLASGFSWGWTARTANDAVQGSSVIYPVQHSVVPAVALATQVSDDRTRTLVLRIDDAGILEVQTMRGASANFIDTSIIVKSQSVQGLHKKETSKASGQVGHPDRADRALNEAIALTVSSNGLNPAHELADFGIGAILVPAGGSASDQAELAVALDSTPGLSQVVRNDQGTLWWVTPKNPETGEAITISRARLETEDGQYLGAVPSEDRDIHAVIPQASESRRLVIAERANTGWRAYLNGAELSSRDTGWAQSFDVPLAGGDLDVRYDPPWRIPVLLGQGLVLAIYVLLAIPIRRRRGAGSHFQPFDLKPTEHSDASEKTVGTTSHVLTGRQERWMTDLDDDDSDLERTPTVSSKPGVDSEKSEVTEPDAHHAPEEQAEPLESAATTTPSGTDGPGYAPRRTQREVRRRRGKVSKISEPGRSHSESSKKAGENDEG